MVHKLNDLFVGKDNLSDLFMGGQFQHFLASPKYAFSRNSEPSVKYAEYAEHAEYAEYAECTEYAEYAEWMDGWMEEECLGYCL